jgi:ParB/RepB/Spo0J family partition protein
MKIPIDLIKPSPHPVRTTWDEDKMNELAQSIKEQGLIVPIKVRPTNGIAPCIFHGYRAIVDENIQANEGGIKYDEHIGECSECDDIVGYVYRDGWEMTTVSNQPFVIVYGHRRVEASRRAGEFYIEAVEEVLNERSAYIQALIENIQREDMTDIELSKALNQLKDKNGKALSARMVANIIGLGPVRTATLMNLTTKDEDIANAFVNEITNAHLSGHLGKPSQPADLATKAQFINQFIKEDKGLRQAIAKKVIKEDLSQQKTKRVAEAIAEAPTPQAKKKLLEWEYSPTIHDPELIKERAKTHGAHDPIYRDNKPSPQKAFDDSPEVKMLIDGVGLAVKTFVDLIKQIQTVASIGKLAPEGKQFMAHKLRSFRKQLDNLIKELEETNG